jgi:hypothetical protein
MVTGYLESPPELEGFSYRNYLMKEGIYSVMDFPKIELLPGSHNRNLLSAVFEKILFIKSL